MIAPAHSMAQISAQLDLVLAHEAQARVVAMRMANSGAASGAIKGAITPQPSSANLAAIGEPALLVRGRRFLLRWCESQLAVRAALVESEQQENASNGMALLLAPGLGELAEDIVARLARQRVFQPEGWAMVRQLFGAKEADARLGRFAWLPQLLLDATGQGPYPPVAHGFLDLDTVWKAFLWRYLQIDSTRPDAGAWLNWTMRLDADASLNLLPASAREASLQWLEQAAGAAGKMIRACIEAGHTGDALALGLVCGVLYAPEGEGQAVLAHAQIRLERFVSEQHVGISEGRAWADAAQRLLQEVLQEAPANGLRPALDRADQILRELRVDEFAHLSAVLPLGFEQRMRFFAQCLQDCLQQLQQRHAAGVSQVPAAAELSALEQAAGRLGQHGLAASQSARMERVGMARRIVRWLQSDTSMAGSGVSGVAETGKPGVAQILCWQADEGAFVDWARARLLGGDELPEVSDAYARLRSLVSERRQRLGQQFAQVLPAWNREASRVNQVARLANAQAGTLAEQRLVPLEAVLERVLAPIAAQQPVLLLVLDGLSTSIFRELFNRMEPLGYREVVPAQLNTPLVGVAAFPTITEVSRASLLCGKLASGAQYQEKAGFASHPALMAQSNASTPPRLFHKGELSDESNLSETVRAALANPAQRVLGIVFNAVDDHLSGPEQLRQRWHLEDLLLLLPILREARAARRAVLITADHGHILNDNSVQVAGSGMAQGLAGGDRWQAVSALSSNPDSAAHSLTLRGGRVVVPRAAGIEMESGDASQKAGMAPDGAGITCLWSETARFGGRKNGYHGGVAPQEVAVPLALLLPTGSKLLDWEDALPPQPEWWDQALPSAHLATGKDAANTPTPVQPRKAGSRRAIDSARNEAQLGLFAPQDDLLLASSPAASTTAGKADGSDWIDAVLNSPIYASQHALAARVAPAPELMRKLLAALDERGGKLSRAALAQKLTMPEVRLSGMLSGARRILNVDQAQVLLQIDASATVELNRPLLLQQFEIKQGGRS